MWRGQSTLFLLIFLCCIQNFICSIENWGPCVIGEIFYHLEIETCLMYIDIDSSSIRCSLASFLVIIFICTKVEGFIFDELASFPELESMFNPLTVMALKKKQTQEFVKLTAWRANISASTGHLSFESCWRSRRQSNSPKCALRLFWKWPYEKGRWRMTRGINNIMRVLTFCVTWSVSVLTLKICQWKGAVGGLPVGSVYSFTYLAMSSFVINSSKSDMWAWTAVQAWVWNEYRQLLRQ